MGRAATDFKRQIGSDVGKVTSYNGRLLPFSTDYHGPSLERIESSCRESLMIVAGHEETFRGCDIRLRYADKENVLCKGLLCFALPCQY
jgi:hypothetical protein